MNIETAPKDGTRILIFSEGRWEIASWHRSTSTSYVENPDGTFTKQEKLWYEGFLIGLPRDFMKCEYALNPTHWQPLPENP